MPVLRSASSKPAHPGRFGLVANSGVGRTMGCADPDFTLCWPPEVRSRPTAAGSARTPSRRRQSGSPSAWRRPVRSSSRHTLGYARAGLSQISSVDGSSGMVVDFVASGSGGPRDPECDCREAEAPLDKLALRLLICTMLALLLSAAAA